MRIDKKKAREILAMAPATFDRRLLHQDWVDGIGGEKDEISGYWTFSEEKVRRLAGEKGAFSTSSPEVFRGEVAETTIEKRSAAAITVADLENFAAFIAQELRQETRLALPAVKEEKIESFKDKQILNFCQAQKYSGLTRNELKEALLAGSVLARKTGKWRIHRSSLEEYCRKFLEEK